MRAHLLFVLACFALAASLHGCGDNDNSAPRETFVFVNGQTFPGSQCPDGTTFVYRTADTLVCDACRDARDCAAGLDCRTRCGPGCEDDTGGCCPVRVCSAV
jgi:hypothetical protein